jgi:hypothetical protein
LDPDSNPVFSVGELFPRLGRLPLSYLVNDTEASESIWTLAEIAPYLQPCNVLLVRGSVFKDLGFEKEECLLYRHTDRTLVAVRPKLADIYNASFPWGGKLSAEDFDHARLIGGYTDEKYDPVRHALLYELGKQLPDIRVGVLERADFDNIGRLVPPVGVVPDFLIMEYYKGAYFPFDGMKGLDISDERWLKRALEYGQGVVNRSIEEKFVSEIASKVSNRGSVTRVTGETYREFVEDPERDVVMLFYAAFDSGNVDTAALEAAAKAMLDEGIETVKFGFINAFRNACRCRMPTMAWNPQLNLFRADNKTQPVPYLGSMNRGAILRFLKEYAAKPINAEVAHITADDAVREKSLLLEKMQDMHRSLLPYAQKYLGDLNAVIDRSSAASPTPKPPQEPQ